MLFARVRHKVLKDDASVDQRLHVELLLEDSHHQTEPLS